ncbi:MAG: aldehyde dehydrogenase family protein [Planctomycetota bacterium]
MAEPELDLEGLFARQRAYVRERSRPGLAERRADLQKLMRAIEERADTLLEALAADLGKCAIEAYTSEVGFVLRDIRHALSHLGGWMKPRGARTPLITRPGRASCRPEPLGVVLIIGPWNYPLQLLVSPLTGAIAAGNAVCLKPSEFAPHVAAAVRELCADVFPADQVTVVEGGRDVSAGLTALPFDHIFFTGSTATGRAVARAAAENLTPVTLELGGKSPCVVTEDAPIATTAKRIVWGKILNAGQTCVAPDHVWVAAGAERELLEALKVAARQLVPNRPPDPEPGDYGRIVNEAHFDRLESLIDGATVFDGGERDRATLRFAPAIVTEASLEHPLMREEIFGPILPVLPYRSLDDVLGRIADGPSPLAAYVFTENRDVARDFGDRVRAGGICINDTVTHLMPADLPFGGVGASGHGRYRGRAGFDAMSNLKAVLHRGFVPDLPLRYPPFKTGIGMIKRSYRWLAR